MSQKVNIICPKHKVFLQTPKGHLRGGCRKCGSERAGNKQKSNKETFIAKAECIHNDKYDYSLVNYVSAKIEVEIICPKHNNFWQTPDSHLSGRGCNKCGFDRTIESLLSNTEKFIEKARKIHTTENGEQLYDYSKVNYVNAKEKVIIICKIHNEFLQTPNCHLNGSGCIDCGGRKQSTTEEFIEKSRKVHGEKYDYSKVDYKNNDVKVVIFCKNHNGYFEQTPTSHLSGNDCNICAKNRKITTEEFIIRANKVHNNFYDYSLVNYVNSQEKIIIICPKHKKFEQLANDHLAGRRCRQCGFDATKLTTEEFIQRADEIHKNKYNYSKVKYEGIGKKVEIICPYHNSFFQTPHGHLKGQGCPYCQKCPSCLLWFTKGNLCAYCKPNKDNKLYLKTKEMEVVRFLGENLPDKELIYNKSVGDTCTGSRIFPDVLFDCGWYNLIVEIDEYQHRNSSYKCEEKRMYDVVANLGLPCIFIRYNPDNKNSDKNVLLDKVKEYLNLTEDCWNEFGLKIEYLFYK
jgi:hypothetical protein